MLILNQLNLIYRNIIKYLVRKSNLNVLTVIKELHKRISMYNYNLPIFYPIYYEKQAKADPDIWNKNISAIIDDIRILNTTITAEETKKNLIINNTQYELSNLEHKLSDIVLYLKEKGNKYINIIPNYIDIAREQTTAEVIPDKNMILPGDSLFILKKGNFTINYTYKIISAYYDEYINNNLSLLSSYNNDVEFVIKSLTKTPQTIELKLQIDRSNFNGIYIESPDINTDILISSNINNRTQQFIRSLFIENIYKDKTEVILNITINEPAEIINKLFLYKIKLSTVIPYTSHLTNKSSFVTTKTIETQDNEFKLSGYFTQNIKCEYSVDDSEFIEFKPNVFVTIKKKETAQPYGEYDNDFPNYIKLMKLSENPKTLEILGPYNSSEKQMIGKETLYITTMQVLNKTLLSFTNPGRCYFNDQLTVIKPNTPIEFLPGLYRLEMQNPTIITDNFNTSNVLFYIKNLYTEIPYMKPQVDLPYVYFISPANSYLYISSVSFAYVYNITNGRQINATNSSNNLEIYITNNNTKNIKIKLYLTESDRCISPCVVFRS